MKVLKCQKKIFSLCSFWAVLLLCTLFSLFGSTESVSAYNLGSTGRYSIMAGVGRRTQIITNNNGQIQTWNNPLVVNGSVQFVETTSVNGGQVREVYLELQSDLPKSLFHFSIRWTTPGSRYNVNYMGITPGGSWTLLDSTCFPQVEYSNNSQTNATDIICDYYGYTEGDINVLYMSGNIMNITTDGFIIVVNGVDYVEVSDVSGGGGSGGYSDLEDDITTIINRLNTNNTQNTYINYNIEDIKDLLEALQAGQLTEQDIENAIDNALESEKDQYEQQQEDVEDSINSSTTQAETQGTTLLGVLTGLITALTNPVGGNCTIDVDLSLYHGGTHNYVDLCHLSPPSGVSAILSIILIVVVVMGTIHIIKAMIGLYREFSE